MGYFGTEEGEAVEGSTEDSGLEDNQTDAGTDPSLEADVATPTEGLETPEPVEGVEVATPEVATEGTYDLDGVQFQGLTKEQTEALSRGVSLNKDYTQGKQKLSEEIKDFNSAVNTARTDPIELRKYFTPEHLIRALGYDPARAAGATAPTAPNAGQIDYTKFEPEAAAVFQKQQSAIEQLTASNKELQGQIGGFNNRFQAGDNERDRAAIETEVGDAMSKFPILNQGEYKDYNRQLILMKIAANPALTAVEIANDVSKVWASGKKPVGGVAPSQTKVVGPGGSVPLAPNQSKTYDEADKSAHGRFGITVRE